MDSPTPRKGKTTIIGDMEYDSTMFPDWEGARAWGIIKELAGWRVSEVECCQTCRVYHIRAERPHLAVLNPQA